MKFNRLLGLTLGLALMPCAFAVEDEASSAELALVQERGRGDRRGRVGRTDPGARFQIRVRPGSRNNARWSPSRGSSNRYRPSDAQWRWTHSRHRRPDTGWRWNRAHYPNWYRTRPATLFPAWRWFSVPRGYWQCISFRSNLNSYVGVGHNLDEAAYSALYECGGMNHEAYGCYIPRNYCQYRN